LQVFNRKTKINTGILLLLQQLKALIFKRFRIFTHRYLLASLILFAPAILECIFCLVIPSQTYLLNNDDGLIRFSDEYKLGLNQYGRFRLPDYLNDSAYSIVPLQSSLDKFYTNENRPFVKLEELATPNISEYILTERYRDVKMLVNDYYVAMNLNITSSDKLMAIIYYSSLAFHSSSNILHEISNLYLSFLRKNVMV
jgi:hypothetical protein